MKKNFLVELINSLTASEKRYFKLYTTLQRGNKNYLKLFDALSIGQTEEKIKEEFRGENFSKNMAESKYYLYALILSSLESYSKKSDKIIRIKELVIHADILYKKGLYDQAWQVLIKAEKAAIKYEQYPQLLEIFSLFTKVARTFTKLKYFDETIQSHLKQEEWVIDKLSEVHKYKSLRLEILKHTITKGKLIRSTHDLEKLESIKNQTSNAINLEGPCIVVIYQYGILLNYFLLKKEFEQMLTYSESFVEYMESHEIAVELHLNSYVRGLNNHLVATLELNLFKKHKLSLEKLAGIEDKVTISLAQKSKIVELSIIRELSYLYAINDFKSIKIKLDESSAYVIDNKEHLNGNNLAIIYFSFSFLYFSLQNYSKALIWISKTLNLKQGSIREDIVYFGNILNIIIHYELENNDYLDYFLRTSNRLMNKENRQYEILLVRSLIKIHKCLIQKEKILMFVQLNEEIKLLEHHSFEKQALMYSYISGWIKSKTSTKDFLTILKENENKRLYTI